MNAAKTYIPFNRASFAGKEQEYILQAIANGHISGDGPFTKRCHEWLEQNLSVPAALLTTSCTAALEMAALLLDLRPGDEVIVPSFTFVTTANAFFLHGAKIVFADIRRDTLNLDEALLEERITDRTRAVVPVHYAGVGCEMDPILEISRRRNLAVIEDNAHGLFGKYRGRFLGTMGALATQSFHETKNITCGEGGALLINDKSLLERAEILREKGTNRSRFFRGLVDKYTWVDKGSSYLPSELLAAFLLAQLQNSGEIQAQRRLIWLRYQAALKDWAAARSISLPHVPAHCEQSFHMFYLLLPSLALRRAFISHLKQRDILSVFHYVPLHLSPMGRQFGGCEGACPVTEDIGDRLVRLPFYNSLNLEDQTRVIEAILEFHV